MIDDSGLRLAELILQFFRGREDVLAVGTSNGFAPERGVTITAERLAAEHLGGNRCLALYLMRPDNTVWCSCADFDNKVHAPDLQWREKATAIDRYLRESGFSPLLEISQSNSGAHDWLFFDKPIPANVVRAFWYGVADRVGVKLKEVYPRQDKLADDGVGNPIRYPLWNQSRFVDANWNTIEPLAALNGIRRATLEQLQALAPPPKPDVKVDGLPPRVAKLVAQPGTMLAKRWEGNGDGLQDGSRSSICCSIASGLIRRYIPTAEVAAALRHWCKVHNYNKGERQDWLDRTIDRAYEFVADHAGQQSERAGPIEYERLTCQQLDSGDYAIEFLIDRTLVAKQPCVLAGPKKALKTSIAVDMGVSIATGGVFLGRLQAKQKRVAIMSGESGLGVLQETARRVCVARGQRLRDIDSLIWSTSLPKLGQSEYLTALERFLKADAIEVLLADPCYLMMPGADASNLFIQGELLGSISEVCQRLGVTLVLLHHLRKAPKKEAFQVPELDQLAWSGFAEFFRQWLLIGRREPFVPGSGSHKLWMSIGGSAGHSSLLAVDVEEGEYDGVTPRQWDVTVQKADEARKETREEKRQAKLADVKERLLLALKKFPEGETMNVVRTCAGVSNEFATVALGELVQAGVATTCKVQKQTRKSPFDGFRLVGN
jgi:hypothetical protein